ncbi:hypothetical protein VTN31DRAFT_5414 [Thermomyces dupontii]|uniref:uncharacterized protein n=1 Tax=Talaromyces thermophilus TaxID=28565 RepID=UPI003742D0A9
MFLLSLPASLLLAQVAVASLRPIPVAPPIKDVASLPINESAFFDQLLDHKNPELGTFPQRYWWNSQWWKGPGSPIIVFQPGEFHAEFYLGYLTNQTVSGLYAQEFGGAVIVLEHRYYGESSPFKNLTTKTLQHLTIENAIQDAIYFAKNVKLPFDPTGGSNADASPWIMVGGSYGGALAGWTAATSPGTYWAYHASSAPVEAIWDYWQYFVPIQEGMPKNCSKDLARLVEHVDRILASGDEKTKQQLKDKFQVGSLQDDDFAEVLAAGQYLWQASNWTHFDEFYTFCDYIENVQGNPPSYPEPDGVGAERALEGYAAWWNEIFFPGCESILQTIVPKTDKFIADVQFVGYDDTDPLSTRCLESYDPNNPKFADTSVRNVANRQWNWILCNEPFASWQDGAPKGTPSIVSRLVTADYWHRQCALYFPEEEGYTYGSAPPDGKRTDALNEWTHGWFGETKRLLWVQGQYDPWITESVSSPFRPCGPKQSTPEAPVYILPNASHCFDLNLRNARLDEGVQDAIDKALAQMKVWLDEWYAQVDRE